MIYIQIQAYVGFVFGAVVMISIHNMIVSFLLYKARQTNMSNILKIIFNFGNILRFGSAWGLYMTPEIATLLQCASLQYLAFVGNVLTRVSLTAFLLWRLKQIHNNKLDNWVCLMLFLLRAGFGVAQFGFQHPGTIYVPDQNIVICDPNESTSRLYVLIQVAIEIIVDIYVTTRLIQVLRNANRNAAQISSNMVNKSKRTLFTAVMYWNFLRLFVAFVFHFAPIFNYITKGEDEVVSNTIQTVINIILSYVITVDAEIVKVIEGREKKNGSSAGTADKSFKSTQSTRAPPYSPKSTNVPPKYSSHFNETHSQIDEEKVAVVSMKRLSFFEWANVVVGGRLRRNNNEYNEHEQYDDDNTEEIVIDGPSEVSKGDIEKGSAENRRDSNLSTSTSMTETSTLDENPDIVIH
ncbi:hypothetical protein RclHR1_15380004 [Rhizophagus clarus]|uniref:G-protein coupled receptors family 1 profile domain-containing protein n=1 Tax=Rhizophagus clarus TaxID=94130 RepID=A0A2Z6R7K4_9GLOM|nr:hypothetical protein RclHR1_15380004 [Rhizophagus clarus]